MRYSPQNSISFDGYLIMIVFNHYERILVVMLLNTIIKENVKLLWYLVADYVKTMSYGSKIDF